jgi:hypothetical protein
MNRREQQTRSRRRLHHPTGTACLFLNVSSRSCPGSQGVMQKDVPMTIKTVQSCIMTLHHFENIDGPTFTAVVTAACDNAAALKAFAEQLFVFHKIAPTVSRNETGVACNAQTLVSVYERTFLFINPTLDHFFRLE